MALRAPGAGSSGGAVYVNSDGVLTQRFEPANFLELYTNVIFDRFISDVGIPVGQAPVPILAPGESVPPLVPAAPPPPPPPIPEEIDRRDVPVSWADWVAQGGALPADWNNYPMASDYPGLIAPVETPPPAPVIGGDDVSWIEDIYDTIDVGLGGWLPGGPVSPWDDFPIGIPYTPPATTYPVPAPAPVPVPTVPAVTTPTTTCSTGPSPVYKKVCGVYKWVYPKRRRRKALVTKSDAQGLATLKGIVGVGKTMDTWIATHS